MARQRKIPPYPVAPDRAGRFLYLFLVKVKVDQDEEKQSFKVGYTTNLDQRHRTLATALPDAAIQLLAAGWFADGAAMEGHILAMLAGARQEREIAKLTPEERTYLVRFLMSGHPNYRAPDEPYDPSAPAVPLPIATRPERHRQGSAPDVAPQAALGAAPALATIDHGMMAAVERSLRDEFDRARMQDWYIELRTFREQYPGCLIAFQRGRRFVFMDDDADLVAAILNVSSTEETVTEGTSEERSRHRRLAAVFIDADDLERQLTKLAQATLHVALVVERSLDEQAQRLRARSTRGVERIITPAMVDGLIGTFIAAISDAAAAALSGYDSLKGEWFVAFWDGPLAAQHLLDAVDRISPVEILVPDDPQFRPQELTPIMETDERARLVRDPSERNAVELLDRVFAERQVRPPYRLGRVTVVPGWSWDTTHSTALLEPYLNSRDPLYDLSTKGAGLARRAAAMIPRYLVYAQMVSPALPPLRIGGMAGTVALDRATRRNLELLANSHGGTAGTLFRTIDKTMTRMGSRALRAQVLTPVRDLAVLNRRFDAIESALRNTDLLLTLRNLLGRIGDLDQLAARVATGRPRPAELIQLRAALVTTAAIRDRLGSFPEGAVTLQGLVINPCVEIVTLLERALADVPVWPAEPIPTASACHQLIRPGYDHELDQLASYYVQMEENRATWTEVVRGEFRTACGTADGVEVTILPYYGPVIVAPSKLVAPLDYAVMPIGQPRGQRYYTNSVLARYGEILSTLPGKVQKAEIAAYQRLCSTLIGEVERIRAVARTLATLDVTISAAVYARSTHAVRPVMSDRPLFKIVGGRHPTVERTHDFVANDVLLVGGNDEARAATESGPRVMVITGANASGKSTLMRQTALIVLMSHCGLFVPAVQATIGLVDGIYSRIGAQDDLVQARSTFQYEMDEIAHIVNHATAHSFVILDEVGRGTDARNGGAIAVGTIKYLYAVNRSVCMVATHHHDIVPLLNDLPRLQCWQMLAHLTDHILTFDYQLVPGAAAQSYGLQLLKMMKIPRQLWELAEQAYADLSSTMPVLQRGDAFTRTMTIISELQHELHGRHVADLPLTDLLQFIERLQALVDMVEEVEE